MAVLVTVLAVVLALLTVLVAGLLRSHAEILRALHALGVSLDPDDAVPTIANNGAVHVPRPRAEPRHAVDISGNTPTGDATSIAVVGARHSTLLAFLTSGCSTCAEFWSALSERELGVPGDARLVIITKGEEAESPALLRKFAPADVPVVMSSATWEAFDVPVAPYFAFVDGPSGAIIGEGAAGTWPHLVGMMEQALADAGASTKRGWRRSGDGHAREERADRDLRSSGIEPGHPSLYPASESDLHEGRPG